MLSVHLSQMCLYLNVLVSADISSASAEDAAATVASTLHYITSKEG